jgi:hypothetical protein
MTSFPTLNQSTSGTAAGLSATLVVLSGGTGSTTAAGARTNLGATGKYAATFGDGSTLSYVITHNLNTNDVIVGVFFVGTPFQVVECEKQLTSVNTVTLLFGSAPASNSLHVVPPLFRSLPHLSDPLPFPGTKQPSEQRRYWSGRL